MVENQPTSKKDDSRQMGDKSRVGSTGSNLDSQTKSGQTGQTGYGSNIKGQQGNIQQGVSKTQPNQGTSNLGNEGRGDAKRGNFEEE